MVSDYGDGCHECRVGLPLNKFDNRGIDDMICGH